MTRKENFEDEAVRTFIELVTISSPTGQTEEFQRYLEGRLESFGLVGGRDAHGNIHYKTRVFDPRRSLLLTTHVDTVSPGEGIVPVVRDGWIRSSGSTILGADPKAGIAAVLLMLDYFQKKKMPLKNIELIFSNNEEEGDHTLNYAQPSSRKAIVLDNGAPIEEVEYRWPFAKVFFVEVYGRKEIHAQHFYNRGANAIVALSEMICRLPWGFYKKGCVANTGIIQGGRSTTLVPDYASLKGNIYCFKASDLSSYINKVRRIIERTDEKYGTRTKLLELENYRGAKTSLNSSFIEQLKSTYRKHGVRIRFCERLLINCNNCLPKGVQSVNVGLGHTNIHTINEKLSIKDFTSFTQILIDHVVSERCIGIS